MVGVHVGLTVWGQRDESKSASFPPWSHKAPILLSAIVPSPEFGSADAEEGPQQTVSELDCRTALKWDKVEVDAICFRV